jgi:hypothetical protein
MRIRELELTLSSFSRILCVCVCVGWLNFVRFGRICQRRAFCVSHLVRLLGDKLKGRSNSSCENSSTTVLYPTSVTVCGTLRPVLVDASDSSRRG